METKRLIPYSVHLPEDVYNKLKEAAGNRKASALVRDAITLIVDGDDEFNGGYNKAVRDVISVINSDQWCRIIGINEQTLSMYLEEILSQMIVHQNVKGKSNGNKKTKG
jgi:hypothetical protein